ncbi:MAG: hypothetical protein IV101_08910 [Dechloromonas sp.]|nr:hypothetical protein [Dechloromonas sp.]
MERQGGKILTSNPSQENILLQLTKGLQSLLDIAEKGEWEKIDGQLQDLLLTMEAVCASSTQNLTKPGSIKQIEQILQLLHSATLLCSERKDQIAPLINAFANAIDTPAKP